MLGMVFSLKLVWIPWVDPPPLRTWSPCTFLTRREGYVAPLCSWVLFRFSVPLFSVVWLTLRSLSGFFGAPFSVCAMSSPYLRSPFLFFRALVSTKWLIWGGSFGWVWVFGWFLFLGVFSGVVFLRWFSFLEGSVLLLVFCFVLFFCFLFPSCCFLTPNAPFVFLFLPLPHN